jgi:hypothetical protein
MPARDPTGRIVPNTLKMTGDPGWIRTSDLQLRRLLLYPLSYGAVRRRSYNRIFTPGLGKKARVKSYCNNRQSCREVKLG